MNRKLVLFVLSLSIAFSQVTKVPDVLLDSLINQAKRYQKTLEVISLVKQQQRATINSLSHADSVIANLEEAYFFQRKAIETGDKIITIYKDRAEEGNRLVTTAIVGLVTYLSIDGSTNERLYVFGSMGITYACTRLFGTPFDFFTVDIF